MQSGLTSFRVLAWSEAQAVGIINLYSTEPGDPVYTKAALWGWAYVGLPVWIVS